MMYTKESISEDQILRLWEVLKPVYNQLIDAGVVWPRLPNNETLVSKLLEFADQDRLKNWVTKYAEAMKE